MSSPPALHEVLTPKKVVIPKSPKSPVSNLREPPSSASASASASASTSAPKKDSPRRQAWKAGSINYLDSLRALPEVRPIPWMPGKELPPDKSTESPRTQTKSAFLLSTRGKINDPGCSHCQSGVGRFLHCITMDGWFHGACATCQMGTRGNLCSLRSDGGGDKTKQQLTDTISTEPPSKTPQSTNFATPQASETKKSATKRKRESLKDESQPNLATGIAPAPKPSYSSPYATIPSTPAQQQPPSYPQFHGHNLAPNYNHQDPAMVNYIYKRPDLANGAVQPPSQPSQPAKGDNLTWIRPAPSAPIASEFHHHRTPPSHNIGHPAKAPDRDESSSLSPSEQLLGAVRPPPPQAIPSQQQHAQYQQLQTQFQQPPIQTNGQVNGGASQAESLPSLVDTLPRKRQKQIHGLIKSLQEGIRRAQTQADTMQNQLNQLQTALGMDGRLDVVE